MPLPQLKAWQHADLNAEFDWLFHDPRSPYRGHTGVDVVMYVRKPVLALSDGVVRFAGDTGVFMQYAGYGKVVEIYNSNEGVWYYLCHLGSIPKAIRPGVKVQRGDVIGYASTKYPHEMMTRTHRDRSRVFDPKAFIEYRTETAIRSRRDKVQRIRKRETGRVYSARRRDILVRRLMYTGYDWPDLERAIHNSPSARIYRRRHPKNPK